MIPYYSPKQDKYSCMLLWHAQLRTQGSPMFCPKEMPLTWSCCAPLVHRGYRPLDRNCLLSARLASCVAPPPIVPLCPLAPHMGKNRAKASIKGKIHPVSLSAHCIFRPSVIHGNQIQNVMFTLNDFALFGNLIFLSVINHQHMSIFTSELFQFVNIPIYHFVKKLTNKFLCVCLSFILNPHAYQRTFYFKCALFLSTN